MNAIRKLSSVVVTVLALNFVAMIIAGAMLAQKAGLNQEKYEQVKAVLFPEDLEIETAEFEDEPAVADDLSPMDQLIAMLDEQSGKPAEGRVVSMEAELDERVAEAVRRDRELDDRERMVRMASDKLAGDRSTFEAERDAWQDQVQAIAQRQADEGFQDALELYESMPAKQVKTIFAQLDDETVLDFLRAMDARPAAKILKEFKTPEETRRAAVILELLREGNARLAAGDNAAAGSDPFAGN